MKKLLVILFAAAALAFSASAQSTDTNTPVYSPVPVTIEAPTNLQTALSAAVASPEVKSNVISFVQGVEAAKSLTVAVYPTYATGLTGSAKWGAGIAAMYPLNGIGALSNNVVAQHTFTGLRFDLMGGNYYASTVALGAKADFQLWGHNFETFVESGANIPLSGAGNNNLAVGAMVGTGIQTTVLSFGTADANGIKPGSLTVFAVAEKWTLYSGYVLHPGVALTWSF